MFDTQPKSELLQDMTNNNVIIYGNGSTAQLLFAYFIRLNYKVLCFTVDEAYYTTSSLLNTPIYPFEVLSSYLDIKGVNFIVGVGPVQQNHIRALKLQEGIQKGLKPISYVSPTAINYSLSHEFFHCKIGDLSIIQPFAEIGSNVFIGSGSIIGHHNKIGDHTFIASGVRLAGNVVIGNHCFIGTGAVVKNDITIGDNVIIGAGVTLLHDAPPSSVWVNHTSNMLPVSSNELSI